MQLLTLSANPGATIREFESSGVTGSSLGIGAGEAHVHTIQFEPGGRIGPHRAGFGELLVPVAGSGWAAGPDGVQFPLELGQAVYFARGELHSKGSETGMTALMILVRDLRLEAPGETG
jgi:quercetin dioxygenase-like cupin family protein